MTHNPFTTKDCDDAMVAKLTEVGVPLMKADGEVAWSEIAEQIGDDCPGYSRGWLVVRYAWLKANRPQDLIDVAAERTKAFKATKAGDTFDEKAWLQGVVIRLRDEGQISWGEIAVRLGMPESKVRSAYRHNGIRKDLGLRIGKGGRFAYGAGELYTDNRKREGAQIPLDLKRKPTVEELLNFIPKEGEDKKTASMRKAAVTKALKIQALLENGATPQAQKDAQKGILENLMKKWNISFQELARERAARGKAA